MRTWSIAAVVALILTAYGCGHSCQFNADCPQGQECLFMASDNSAEMCCPSNLQCNDTCCDNGTSCDGSSCVGAGQL
jgi:hypothetical protein